MLPLDMIFGVQCVTQNRASRPQDSLLRKNTVARKERSRCRCFEQANGARIAQGTSAFRRCINS